MTVPSQLQICKSKSVKHIFKYLSSTQAKQETIILEMIILEMLILKMLSLKCISFFFFWNVNFANVNISVTPGTGAQE